MFWHIAAMTVSSRSSPLWRVNLQCRLFGRLVSDRPIAVLDGPSGMEATMSKKGDRLRDKATGLEALGNVIL
jgi:hypothetical protein